MQRKFLFLLAIFVSFSLVLSMVGSGVVYAQDDQPPPRSRSQVPPRPISSHPLATELQAQADLQAQVALGQPGLSFRYVDTFGITGEPYVADGNHIFGATGIFIDTSNSLYVTELKGHRILEFNSAGANTHIYGHAGIPWAHDDYVAWPQDVAKDAAGNLWVVYNGAAIKQFDPAGNMVQFYPAVEPWVRGNDTEHFDNPTGIAFDASGLMYISDTNNHRIQVYNVSGLTPVYQKTIGETGVAGADNAHFDQPHAIAFDSLGRLYVMDTGNYRVQRCTKNVSGNWVCETFFGSTGVPGNDLSHLAWAFGITVDGNNSIYIADGDNYRILKCTVNKTCAHFAGTTGERGSDNSHFYWPNDIDADSTGNVFVSDFDNHRVQKFNSLGVYQSTIGVSLVPYLTDADHINQPWGIAVNSTGEMYITENSGYRLLKLNAAGSQLWTVGQPGVFGSDNDHLGSWWAGLEGNPAVNAAGRILVPDTSNDRVQIFNANGTYYQTLGGWGQGDYEFSCPSGIGISPVNGDVYIADHCNHRIQVFTSALVYKATLGETGVEGSDNTHFRWPYGVAIAANGDIFVADAENFRVQKCRFTTGTNYTCSTFAGQTNVAPDGSFNYIHPISVAVDGSARVYIVDDWNGRVNVYNSSGAYLTSIGGAWGQGTGGLMGPSGVALDGAGNVYVTDRDGHRIQKFALGVPGWEQANINGFGNPQFHAAYSMTVFNGQLYAGAAGPEASIWRTSNGTSWSPAMTGGFGQGVTNPAVIGMTVFNGQLYAGTGWGGAPGQLWRSPNGTTWNQITGNGLGVTTSAPGAFAVYNNLLYVGTCGNEGVPGAQIMRSATGDSNTWLAVVHDGLKDANNNCVTSLTAFNGALYAAVENREVGARIWRSTTGDENTWAQVNTTGFGSASNTLTSGFAVYKGYLYIGTFNPDTGGQLWRSNNGTTWNPVMTNGFGDVNNGKLESLYVFGNRLYAGLNNRATGLEVWQSPDGTTFSQINPDGFGSDNSHSTLWSNETISFNGALYIGVANDINGLQIWRTVPVTISGNVGVAGATLTYDGLTVTSQPNGSYSIPALYDWSGTVTPSHPCFTFNPPSKTYTNLVASQASQNFTASVNPGAGCADIDIRVGGNSQGRFGLPSQGSTRASFAAVNNGPVKIISTNGVPLIAAERLVYKVNGVNTSFTEMMALPNGQLDKMYWLPWYNNKDFDTQLRFANVSGATATVHVLIGGQEMAGSPFTLAAGESTRKSFAGVNNGPVKIESDQNIVAAERLVYKVNGVNTSYTEMMALANSQLDKMYWLPWYNNKDFDTQLRFANVSDSIATVHVFIGGQEMAGSPFLLDPGASTRKSFTGINNGPVKIESDQNIVAAERLIYKVNNIPTSYSEIMAHPNSQLDTTYWLPWYNNTTDLDTQLRFANVSDATATVHVLIGGQEMAGSPFTLLAGESTRKSFVGINNGPVQIVSDQNVVAAERVIYKVNGIHTSYSEMMGLPDSQLNTIFWLPWYNNVDLDTQLRFGVP